MSLQAIKASVKQLTSPIRAKQMQRFFKTAKGQYGQGDIFAGLTGPQCRQLAKKNKNLHMNEIQQLIQSQIHQERSIALIILNHQFAQKSKKLDNIQIQAKKKKIVDFYLKNTKFINNWDLVDISAHKILGQFLKQKDQQQRKILYELAISQSLWQRRISIISTFTFIKNDDFEDTLKIVKLLLKDKHDLIHKGIGWMLRQVGKRDQQLLQEYLIQNYDNIPRTALRYAIQKFEQVKRQNFLKGIF